MNEFLDCATTYFIERSAAAKAFYNRESHSHGFLHEGKCISAIPEPEVSIKPLSKKGKYSVDVKCPICKITLPETRKDMIELIDDLQKRVYTERNDDD